MGKFLSTALSLLLLLILLSSARAGDRSVPQKAWDVYHYVLEHNRAPDGYVGGRVWQNREHRLPRSGAYREYDVNPKVRGKNRGPERLIVNLDTRQGWYTADHYRTFIPLITRGRNDRTHH